MTYDSEPENGIPNMEYDSEPEDFRAYPINIKETPFQY